MANPVGKLNDCTEDPLLGGLDMDMGGETMNTWVTWGIVPDYALNVVEESNGSSDLVITTEDNDLATEIQSTTSMTSKSKPKKSLPRRSKPKPVVAETEPESILVTANIKARNCIPKFRNSKKRRRNPRCKSAPLSPASTRSTASTDTPSKYSEQSYSSSPSMSIQSDVEKKFDANFSPESDVLDGTGGWTDLKKNRFLRRKFFEYFNQNKPECLKCPQCPNKGLETFSPTFNLVNYYYTTKKNVLLESYYYGSCKGKNIETSSYFPAKLKCPEVDCGEEIAKKDIIRHIVTHILWTENVSRTQEDRICPYCLRPVKSTSSITDHIEKKHKTLTENGLCCRICCTVFEDEVKTTTHMWEKHCEGEMPFKCPICDFRTSFLYTVADHFEQTHEDMKKVICPICLKSFACDVELKDYLNIKQHIRAHLLQGGAGDIKCAKCALKFVADYDYIQHLSDKSLHSSMTTEEDYERYFPESEVVCLLMAKDPNTIEIQPPCPHLNDPKPEVVSSGVKSDDDHHKMFAQVVNMMKPSLWVEQSRPSPKRDKRAATN